jgi:hypothetical protein
VATILTTAVSDIARTVGGFATEVFEIRDAARRAGQDHEDVYDVVPPADAGPGAPDSGGSAEGQ